MQNDREVEILMQQIRRDAAVELKRMEAEVKKELRQGTLQREPTVRDHTMGAGFASAAMGIFFILMIVALPIIYGLLGAACASARNRSGLGFLLGLFGGPIGLIAAALVQEDEDAKTGPNSRHPSHRT